MKKDFNVFTNFNPPCLGECLFRPVGRAGNETDNEISNFYKIKYISHIYESICR
mgnify:CR=1 FL=1